MKLSRVITPIFLLLAFGLSGLIAEEVSDTSLDALLGADGNPAGDIEEPLVKPTFSPSLRVKVSMDADLALTAGWQSLSSPLLDQANFDIDPYYRFKPALILDARPDKTIRMLGSVGIDVPDLSVISWENFKINELFLDYTLLDTLFTRIGKFSVNWGQELLLKPSPLLNNLDSDIKLKMSLPLAGLNIVALGATNLNAGADGFTSNDLVLAINIDGASGPISLGAAASWQPDTSILANVFAKLSLGSFDLALQGTGVWDETYAFLPEGLAQVIWKEDFWGLKFVGEYCLQAASNQDPFHTFALALRFDNIPGATIRPGLEWRHTTDHSVGRLSGGFSTVLIDHLSLNMALSWNYGGKDAESRAASTRLNVPSTQADPAGRAFVFVIALKLSAAYEGFIE